MYKFCAFENGDASFVRPAKVRCDVSATATLVRPQNTTLVRPIGKTRRLCDLAQLKQISIGPNPFSLCDLPRLKASDDGVVNRVEGFDHEPFEVGGRRVDLLQGQGDFLA